MWIRCWLSLAVVLLGLSALYADIPGPGPRPERPLPWAPPSEPLKGEESAGVPLVVRLQPGREKPRLTIPRKLVAGLRSTVERSGQGVGGWSPGPLLPLAAAALLAGLGLTLVRGRARVALASVLVVVAAVSLSSGPATATPGPLRVIPELKGIEVVYPEEGQAVVLEVDPKAFAPLSPPRNEPPK